MMLVILIWRSLCTILSNNVTFLWQVRSDDNDVLLSDAILPDGVNLDQLEANDFTQTFHTH